MIVVPRFAARVARSRVSVGDSPTGPTGHDRLAPSERQRQVGAEVEQLARDPLVEPAQDPVDAGHELGVVERLGDVVLGVVLDQLGLRARRRDRRQDDDRDVRPPLDPGRHLLARRCRASSGRAGRGRARPRRPRPAPRARSRRPRRRTHRAGDGRQGTGSAARRRRRAAGGAAGSWPRAARRPLRARAGPPVRRRRIRSPCRSRCRSPLPSRAGAGRAAAAGHGPSAARSVLATGGRRAPGAMRRIRAAGRPPASSRLRAVAAGRPAGATGVVAGGGNGAVAPARGGPTRSAVAAVGLDPDEQAGRRSARADPDPHRQPSAR